MRVPKELSLIDATATNAFVARRKLAKRLRPWWTDTGTRGAFLSSGDLTLKKLRLDHLDDGRAFIGERNGLIIDGNLTVEVLENGEQDFGPFLIVLGDLIVQRAAVGGSPIHVAGDLRIGHCFHGYYNHGFLTVEGKTRGGVLLADDYNAVLQGPVTSKVSARHGYVKARLPAREPPLEKLLLPAFIEIDDDGEDKHVRMDGGKIYKALVAGKSVTRAR